MVKDELTQERAINHKLRDAIQGDLKSLKDKHFQSKFVSRDSRPESESKIKNQAASTQEIMQVVMSLKEEMAKDHGQILETKNELIFSLKAELKKEKELSSELQAKFSSLEKFADSSSQVVG